MEDYRGRQVREAFARVVLGDLLSWAYDDALPHLPEDQLEDFLYGMRGRVSAAAPEWRPALDALRRIPAESLRSELARGFRTIRALAQDVARGESSSMVPIKVWLYVPHQATDRDGRPGWHLDGRLADALVWAAIKLFSAVSRSLIRRCAMCPRVYVASKNQRFCVGHQAEAQRLAQRRAERAFHERLRLAGGRIRTRAGRTKLVTKRRRKTT